MPLVTRNVPKIPCQLVTFPNSNKVAWETWVVQNVGGHTSKWGPPQLLLSRESPRYARVVQGVKVILEEQGFLEQGNLWAEHPNFKCEDPAGAFCCSQIL